MVEINLHIPDEFFEEEVRDGYFVSLKTKKIWAVELDLLNEFIRVCDKYGIKYFLDAGTLLGAIRHGGFIPWDDDIDVAMMRSDYERLEQIAEKEFKYPYFWQTEKTDPGSMRGHGQLRNSSTTGILTLEKHRKFKFNQGIFLDVFPLDYVPDESVWQNVFFEDLFEQREKAYKFAYMTTRFRDKGYGAYKNLRRFKHNLLTLHNRKNSEYEKWELLMQKYNDNPTQTVAKLFLRQMQSRLIVSAELYESLEDSTFEMLKVKIPSRYDELLTQYYGEWRSFDTQPSFHGGVVFDVDRSYKEYIK